MVNIINRIYNLGKVYRWSGVYSTIDENVAQHSYNVIFLTHLLCEIRNKMFNEKIDVRTALIMAIYHDVADSNLTHITREVKCQSYDLEEEFNTVRNSIKIKMYDNEIIDGNIKLFDYCKNNTEQMKIIEETIEAADKIDALIKCKTEVMRGNFDFKDIYKRHYKELMEYMKERKYLEFFYTRYLEEILKEIQIV